MTVIELSNFTLTMKAFIGRLTWLPPPPPPLTLLPIWPDTTTPDAGTWVLPCSVVFIVILGGGGGDDD